MRKLFAKRVKPMIHPCDEFGCPIHLYMPFPCLEQTAKTILFSAQEERMLAGCGLVRWVVYLRRCRQNWWFNDVCLVVTIIY